MICLGLLGWKIGVVIEVMICVDVVGWAWILHHRGVLSSRNVVLIGVETLTALFASLSSWSSLLLLVCVSQIQALRDIVKEQRDCSQRLSFVNCV